MPTHELHAPPLLLPAQLAHSRLHTHERTHTRTHARTYIHTHTHTHTRTPHLLVPCASRPSSQASIVSSIRALPTKKWSAASKEKNGGDGTEDDDEEEECSLCMERFEEPDEVRLLKCGHYFHTECIDKWLVVGQQLKPRSCPYCNDSAV